MCWVKEESCLVCKKKRRHDGGVGEMAHIRCVGKEGLKTYVLERKGLRQVYWEGRGQDRCVELGITTVH